MSLVTILIAMNAKKIILIAGICIFAVAATLLATNIAPNSFLGDIREDVFGKRTGLFAATTAPNTGPQSFLEAEQTRYITERAALGDHTVTVGDNSIGNAATTTRDPEVVEVEGDAAADPRDRRPEEARELTDADLAAGVGDRTHEGEKMLEDMTVGTKITRISDGKSLKVVGLSANGRVVEVTFRDGYGGEPVFQLTLKGTVYTGPGLSDKGMTDINLSETEEGVLILSWTNSLGGDSEVRFPLADVR